jgi:hypothetical protein
MKLYQIRRAKELKYSLTDGVIIETPTKREIMKHWRQEGYGKACYEAIEHGYEPPFGLYEVSYKLIAGDGFLK